MRKEGAVKKQATQILFSFDEINRASGAIEREKESGKVTSEAEDQKTTLLTQYDILKNLERFAAFEKNYR